MVDFKTMGAIAGLLKNRDKLEAAAQRIKDQLAATEVTGEAAGGAVRAVVGGDLKVRSITLEPAVTQGLGADDNSRSLAQTLIVEAVNDGMTKAQQAARDIVQREAADLGLPQLPQLSGLLP
jgi:nucleoid-associated protein EbfC